MTKEVYNFNRGFVSVAKKIDKFQVDCVKNGLLLKSLSMRNLPNREWSSVKVSVKRIK